MGTLTHIYRHPIKSHGRESMQSVTLEAGKTMPYDRHWAVAHDRTKFDKAAPEWTSCGSFARGAKAPQLMAIEAALDDATGILTLTHPKLDSIKIDPNTEAGSDAIVEWVHPIMPKDWFAPAYIARAPDRGMTDTSYPSISINSNSSNAALGQIAGEEFSQHRWRGNLWVDGFDAWDEFNWVGHDVAIGETVLGVRAPIERCNATKVDPFTGEITTDTLNILNTQFGHQNFGVYIEVIEGGVIKVGDKVTVI